MFTDLRKTWEELGRNIYEGERFEKNLRGISLVALLMIVVNTITGVLNLRNGYYGIAAASFLLLLAGLLILYFARFRRNRRLAVAIALSSLVLLLTYEIFTVSHGFPIFWTLLVPMTACYLASVKTGLCVSFYFLVLYWVLFFTPLRDTLGRNYPDYIAQRFPLLYLANVILTAYIMTQYHRTTLYEMDHARQLTVAKEEADRANDAKSDFLANMSHEIRTPINAVLGMNEVIMRESTLALEGTPPEEREKTAYGKISVYARNIESAGRTLLSIINDILDFSKIEAGRMVLIPGSYSLSSVLNDVSNTVCFRVRDKGLDFQIDVDETIPDGLYGDAVRVRQVIMNLLSNAVKYTNRGGICVTVRSDPETANVGETILLTVSVRDTGIGIKPDDLSKLFTKFQRVDLDRNSTVEGTGLGLAITKNLVSMMDGEIHVESSYGVGSTFTVTIPQRVASCIPVGNIRTQIRERISGSALYRETFQAPDAQILIVDDINMNLTVVTGLLEKTKIRIDTASSGTEAIALARTRPYDVILMDQRMPEMDGTEVLHRIRGQKDGANRKTPVICLTADAVIGAKERYIAEGFSDYLTKPIESSALEKMMVEYLPKEKIVSVQAEEQGRIPSDSAWQGGDLYVPLAEAGVRPETGLRYSQGDEAFYRSMLREYGKSAEKKTQEIQSAFEQRDWKNYAVYVHSVKSTSRMIGAESLSEAAERLEHAADRKDEEEIRALHPGMMAQYRSVAGAVRLAVGEEIQEESEEEILEFYPDDSGEE